MGDYLKVKVNGAWVGIPSTSDGSTLSENVDRLLSFDDWPQYYGMISNGKWSFADSSSSSYGKYKFTVISVNGGEKIYIDGYSNGKVSIVKSFSPPVQGADAPPLATGISQYNMLFYVVNNLGTLPADARYLIIQTRYNNVVDTWAPNVLRLNNSDYMVSVRDELANLNYENGVNWLNFGDSITCGYISFFLDKENDIASTDSTSYSSNWTYLVSKINNWNYVHSGQGGQGWINGNSAIYKYVRGRNDYANFNLITFAVGINDWKGKWPYQYGDISDPYTYADDLTPTTVVESMRYCFDYILRRNPEVKIIVISPFNCRGYKTNGVHPYGSYETSWARGYKRYNQDDTEHLHGKSLDDFVDIMQSVCDEYGIEMIDMTRHSVLNRANLIDLLPDGVHPSLQCHRMFARELSRKLNFNTGSDIVLRTDYTGGLVVSPQSVTVQEGSTATISVCLDTQPDGPVYITLESKNRDKLTCSSYGFTLTPEDYSTPRTITLTAKNDDDTSDDDLIVYVVIPQSPTGEVVEVPVTITDDD